MSEPQILTRADIDATEKRTRELVSVPEWGGSVYVQSLNGDERDQFEESLMVTTRRGGKKERDVVLKGARAKLCALCIVDGDGQRLYTDEEVDVLGQERAAALDRVFEVAQKLNGMSDEDLENTVADFTDTPNDSGNGI